MVEEAAAPLLIAMQFKIVVLRVTNLRDDLAKGGDQIKIGWKRKDRLIETKAYQVVDRMALADESWQMNALMEYDAETQALASKVTQLQIRQALTGQVIAEADFDLAAFASREIFEYRLKMTDTVPLPTQEILESYASDTSLESLLYLTDDSFEMERKAVKRITHRLNNDADRTELYLQILSMKDQSGSAANRGRSSTSINVQGRQKRKMKSQFRNKLSEKAESLRISRELTTTPMSGTRAMSMDFTPGSNLADQDLYNIKLREMSNQVQKAVGRAQRKHDNRLVELRAKIDAIEKDCKFLKQVALPNMRADYTCRYNRLGVAAQESLINLDQVIQDQSTELQKLKKQNRKIKKKLLPQPGTTLARLVATRAEFEMLRIKMEDADTAVSTYFDFDQDPGRAEVLNSAPFTPNQPLVTPSKKSFDKVMPSKASI